MTPHPSIAPPGAFGATLPEDGEGDGGDETGSDATGAAVTAPDPAPPPENGAAPPVSSAAPPAAPRVPSALRRPASPPSRRRTPAPAGSRGGRRRAVTTQRATGGGPAAREGGRIAREFQISANFRKKSLLNSLFSGNRPPAAHRRVQVLPRRQGYSRTVLGQLRAVEIQATLEARALTRRIRHVGAELKRCHRA
jgi:hypothetical protein